MFHVAALLPFSADDTQQVERKRHLGNDVVLVIFLERGASEFDPRILTSHFNSAFVVVRPAEGRTGSIIFFLFHFFFRVLCFYQISYFEKKN